MTGSVPAYLGMVDAARLAIDGLLAEPVTTDALLDPGHVDHADQRQAVRGLYETMADYAPDGPDALALIRDDLATAERDADRTAPAERRRRCLRAILQPEEYPA